uniref:Uncharacterized protein n=1 Tax=Anopheles atroparvus TaxID=41427 RepID=A0A182J691_ANOAO
MTEQRARHGSNGKFRCSRTVIASEGERVDDLIFMEIIPRTTTRTENCILHRACCRVAGGATRQDVSLGWMHRPQQQQQQQQQQSTRRPTAGNQCTAPLGTHKVPTLDLTSIQRAPWPGNEEKSVAGQTIGPPELDDPPELPELLAPPPPPLALALEPLPVAPPPLAPPPAGGASPPFSEPVDERGETGLTTSSLLPTELPTELTDPELARLLLWTLAPVQNPLMPAPAPPGSSGSGPTPPLRSIADGLLLVAFRLAPDGIWCCSGEA